MINIPRLKHIVLEPDEALIREARVKRDEKLKEARLKILAELLRREDRAQEYLTKVRKDIKKISNARETELDHYIYPGVAGF